MTICNFCYWYSEDENKCKKDEMFNELETGTVGIVESCAGFVEKY